MAVARLLDVRHGDGIIAAPNLNQEHYINWVRFLRHCASNGLCTIVASYFGTTGTGEDFHDGVNPADDRAFIYAEFAAGVQRFGVLVQWADAETWPVSGVAGGPSILNNNVNNDGVGIAMAFREDGTSPWPGTTNDDGSDTKGATPNTGPVFTPGTSVVHVFPRANAPGPPAGSFNTDKHMLTYAGQDDASGFSRAHWVANEDGIFQLFSVADGGDYTALYLGRYTPIDGATLTEPYVMIARNAILSWPRGSANVYGDTAGSDTDQGGIVGIPSDGVQQLSVNVHAVGQTEAVFQPNMLRSPNVFEGGPWSVFQRESVGGTFGYAGDLPTELVGAVYNTNNHNTNAAATRAFIGENTIAQFKWDINWDGGAAPGLNNTRLGRLSFTP